MPLQYKIPGYAGNALLLLLAILVAFGNNFVVGALLATLAGLNLYLVYKLDSFSREEVWLAHELEMAKMKEELLVAQKRIGELEGGAAAPSVPGVPAEQPHRGPKPGGPKPGG